MSVPETIYALTDRAGEIRYVGRTSKPLRERLQRHRWQASQLNGACDRHVSRWIRAERFEVAIVALEETTTDARDAERRWVETLRARGARLTNLTRGGEGAPPRGFLLSPEQREKISAANRRRWSDPAKRAELAERNRQGLTGFRGRQHSAETREKIGASSRGIKRGTPSEETRRKMSESAKRRRAREKGVV